MEALQLNIYTKFAYGWLVHALVHDLKLKKMWSTKDHFFDFRVSLPGSQTIFMKISAKTKIFLTSG